jgi:hypothetical protein
VRNLAAVLLMLALLVPPTFQVTTITLLRKFQSRALAVGITSLLMKGRVVCMYPMERKWKFSM